ncbi:bacillithiol biosynthesis cysteine-adding enzyme BshC [Litchfieldia salsa]|uniref:Putative cysteine ligase BshC n=1 Tax=Litchfieldia salsa TaxID=930152 RepID=A0A1H0REX3_9BACI|nr:bacillithiol biosynthesis cysteine-adding enzyme BshC [Litchfieldia salsa]SDP28097.1 bacillithiol biosynthesis cysteine-adding enzyme BshC [Litchfieldia salsa]
MEVISLSLPSTNKLVADYVSADKDTSELFHYDFQSQFIYEERKKDLLLREFPREKLASYLEGFNGRYGLGRKTFNNITRLLDPTSLVVIGGQQAGLLTGPLFTIHKIISILTLAKEQEEKLNVPVIPVFWIAGEDHDFQEINHIYIKNKQSIKKKMIEQKQLDKTPVSSVEIDKVECKKWIDKVLESYGETAFTRDILSRLNQHLDRSTSYVDFFAAIISDLFGHTGIVLLDSASNELRGIESEFFVSMIEKNEEMYDAVRSQQEFLTEAGYPLNIEMPESSSNLFYHHENERFLLEYDKENLLFRNRNKQLEITKEELLVIAKKHPTLLSNNVVTRPLMQELLFPSLAFISGPGEVAYWAELKKMFEIWGMKLPPIVPRITMTILERSIETDLDDRDISINNVLNGGLFSSKEQWLMNQTGHDITKIVDEAKQQVEQIHKRVREAALGVDDSLEQLLGKNSQFIQSQLDFVTKAVQKKILLKHHVELSKYERIETSILPNRTPQERVWNIYYYLNKYGLDFVNKLLEVPLEVDGKHKIIRL